MTRGKFKESFEREYEQSLKLGIENAEQIKNAKNWCKHFRVEMVSAGLLAQMSRLPIGSHSISCQYAKDYSESMNLPWIIPEFIIENCSGCPHHSPNGDTSWAEQIIENHNKKQIERTKSEQAREAQLEKIRDQLRKLSVEARQTSEITERKILEFVEKLFSDNETEQKNNLDLLINSARIGADLFSPLAIDILIDQSLSEEFSLLCLPICGELAGHRKDLTDKLKNTAFGVINRRLHPELAAQILANLGGEIGYPLQDTIISNLINNQQHRRPIGGLYEDVPKYPNSNELLIRSYDASPESVTAPLQKLLQQDDKYIRINACGIIKFIQNIRPQIGIDLLDSLVASLELPDDMYEDSADAKARQRIAKAFIHNPTNVDEYLLSQIPHKRSAVQQEIIAIYGAVIRNAPRNDDESKLSKESEVEIEISIRRCFEFMKNENLNLEVRCEAEEVIKRACSRNHKLVEPYFDSILGYYAIICSQDQLPKLSPKIVLPNQPPPDPMLGSMDEFSHQQNWTLFKRNLLNILEDLAKKEPSKVGNKIIECFENLDTKTNERFKSAIVKLLGKIGKEYILQPRVLPLVMKALMDFESQVIRASGIQAVEEMYRRSQSNPPKDLVDIVILHLRDNYVIVHKAAIHALRRKWLNRNQTFEALKTMIDWLYTYKNKNDPYYLDDLGSAILGIASQYPDLKNIAVQVVVSVLPTNVALVDEGLLERLIQHVKPDEPVAEIIGKQTAWFLANYNRDRYNQYEFSTRAELFNWFHQIPNDIYLRIRSDLFDAGKQVAERDAWESCIFASLMAQHGDYDLEMAILDIAEKSLSGEKRYQEFRKRLKELQLLAAINVELVNGNLSSAQQLFSEIGESGS